MFGTWDFFTAVYLMKNSDIVRNSYKLDRNDFILSTGITAVP